MHTLTGDHSTDVNWLDQTKATATSHQATLRRRRLKDDWDYNEPPHTCYSEPSDVSRVSVEDLRDKAGKNRSLSDTTLRGVATAIEKEERRRYLHLSHELCT
eukprot:COSAG02_NODE_3075_length_7421_cov_1.971592_5_plen_102_part_00